MEKSNLINTLRTFDKKEFRDFRKWLQSPAHNQREDVMALFDYLASGNHLFSEKHLAKPKAFRAVYPDRTFSDAEMRQVMHFLFRTVEEFLVHQELLKDEVRVQATLAKVYRKRQLPKLFKRAMDSGWKIQDRQHTRNSQFYENEMLLQYEQYSYLSGLGRNVPLNLQEVSDASDVAFLANKLRLGCIMLSHQAVFKTEYDMGILTEAVHKVEEEERYLDVPAVAIYYHGFRAISMPEKEEHYQKLKAEILRSGSLFPHSELRVIYLMAINYTIQKTNAGKRDYFREAFELYQAGMKTDLFLENGMLSRFTFGNSISIALNLKEFDWVEKQIAESSPKLEEKYRENFVRFYRARLHFERKEYDEAMLLLAQSDYDDILMNLHAKTMLMKMYYELDEENVLDSLLSSMRTYLQRKKLLGYHKTNYKNIISLTKKLLRINPFESGQKEKLKTEIEATSPLTERNWLLEQLDKM